MRILNEKGIATIACKVLSIYSVIKGMERISYMISIMLQPSLSQGFDNGMISQMIYISIIPSVTLIIIGILLWAMSSRISEIMVNNINGSIVNRSEINILELQSAAFSVVGLLILVNLISEISSLIPQIAELSGEYIPTGTTYRLKVKVSMIEAGVKLILGLLLLFKSSGLVGVVKNLRKAGLKDIE